MSDEMKLDLETIKINEETKKGIKGLKTFIEYWDKDFKPFARKCIEIGLPLYIELSRVTDDTERFLKNNNIITITNKDNSVKYTYKDKTQISNDDQKVLKAFQNHLDKIHDESIKLGIVDFMAIHYINEMISNIEECISNFKNPALCALKVYNVFSDNNYYQTIFKNNENCEEAENYKQMTKKIEHIFILLKDVK